jgi:hypothetical protein
VGSVEPEISTVVLPDGQMGVIGAWKRPDGLYLRHGVRVAAGDMTTARAKLKDWYDGQRQTET